MGSFNLSVPFTPVSSLFLSINTFNLFYYSIHIFTSSLISFTAPQISISVRSNTFCDFTVTASQVFPNWFIDSSSRKLTAPWLRSNTKRS